MTDRQTDRGAGDMTLRDRQANREGGVAGDTSRDRQANRERETRHVTGRQTEEGGVGGDT